MGPPGPVTGLTLLYFICLYYMNLLFTHSPPLVCFLITLRTKTSPQQSVPKRPLSLCSWFSMTDNMKIWSTFELSRLLTGWCLKGTPPSQADKLETVVHRRFLHCQGQRVLDQWISHHHPPLITPSDQSQSSSLLCILDKYNNTAIVQHSFLILPFVTFLPTCHIFNRPDLSGKKKTAERRHMDDGDEDVWGFLMSA